MRRIYLTIVALTIFMVVSCTQFAMAAPILAGDYIKLVKYNPLDSAGIMTYAISNDQGSTILFYYDSFCIQDNTYITPNTWYKVQSLTNMVGPYDYPSNSLPGEGPLNGAVDYLYYKYTAGAYNSVLSNNLTNQADLQATLWSLQGSGPLHSPNATMPWAVDLNAYQSDLTLQHPWGTSVINIVGVNFNPNAHYNQNIQNQLYNTVPEPASLLLLGGGLAALLVIRRRK